MKLRIMILLGCLIAPFQLVHADIAGDMGAGLAPETVIANALAENQKIDQIVAEMVTLAHAQVANTVKNLKGLTPEQRAAKTKELEDKLDAAITSAAVVAKPGQRAAIETAAIGAGADPTTVTTASAAGAAGGTGVTGVTSVTSVTSVTGSGGGGVASDN